MEKNTRNFVLAQQITDVFFLKKKDEQYENDYVDEYFTGEKRKAQIISEWALTLEKLQQQNEYHDSIDSICSHIRKRLRDRGLPEGALSYVNEVLPSRFKNENLIREEGLGKTSQLNEEVFDDEEDFENVELSKTTQKNLYTLGKKIDQMSAAELQDYYRQFKIRTKESRIRDKAAKELIINKAIQKQIPLPEYKKISKEVPSEHLHGISKLYNVWGLVTKDYVDIAKHMTDIHKSIYQFKPSDEIAEEVANNLLFIRNTFVKNHKSLFVPFSDDKWAMHHFDWLRTQLVYLKQSKNAAGVSAAIATGEIAIRMKNGKKIIVPLKRGTTREQVGDILPDIIEFCQDLILSYPIVKELISYTDRTYIVDFGAAQQQQQTQNNNNNFDSKNFVVEI